MAFALGFASTGEQDDKQDSGACTTPFPHTVVELIQNGLFLLGKGRAYVK